MAVQAITHRHVRELALAWWRQEASPMLLSRGTLDAFLDIESRMEAYLVGAAIDPATALAYLRATWNPDADDALADVVAGMLLLDAAAESLERQDVLDTLPGASLHARAHQCARRWAGLPAPDGESLRFIDAAGVVRGHFEPTESIGLFSMQNIDIANMQNIGVARMTTIGVAYNLNVGMMMATTVGMSQVTKVGKTIDISAGEKLSIKVDVATPVMKSDGTITVNGKDITVTGSNIHNN